MNDIWDIYADSVKKGDKKRDVRASESHTDETGTTHYLFTRILFKNPWYSIPKNDLEVFERYIEGGGRSYPSDGNIPCDIIAKEARIILKKIEACSNDPTDLYCQEAREALRHGKYSLVRGTLKLYLGKYTTRDWRRKRFTDDIDFWTFQVNLLESALQGCSFTKNKKSGEWEKKVKWQNPITGESRTEELYAANNLNQLLDFGAGSYLEGSDLKEIFSKKIKRGHDVDLSDIINVAMVNDGATGNHVEEWLDAFSAFEEAINTRNSRTISNIISLCRYALAIADHLESVAKAINKHNDLILDDSKIPNSKIEQIVNISIHWQNLLKQKGFEDTRKEIHNFYHEQALEKPKQAENLRNFVKSTLNLLNSKYEYLQVNFEIK